MAGIIRTGILGSGLAARAAQDLLGKPLGRGAMGKAARRRAEAKFSAGFIVPQYEALYRRVCKG